jgi:tRNA threonylcarbamoyladenosine biosynthesis protein TsaB
MPIHILQIETSTEVCSVAISSDGITIADIDVTIANSHSELITLTIMDCISKAGLSLSQIDAIAIGSGPGSYTSLRVGYSTAKGLCYSIDKPLITINSLKILAASIEAPTNNACIVSMIDARRMDAYVSIYTHTLEEIIPGDAYTLEQDSFVSYCVQYDVIHLCGTGASKFVEHFPDPRYVLGAIDTKAAFMSKLAYNAYVDDQFADVAYCTPNYIKSPNITQSKKKFF